MYCTLYWLKIYDIDPSKLIPALYDFKLLAFAKTVHVKHKSVSEE